MSEQEWRSDPEVVRVIPELAEELGRSLMIPWTIYDVARAWMVLLQLELEDLLQKEVKKVNRQPSRQ